MRYTYTIKYKSPRGNHCLVVSYITNNSIKSARMLVVKIKELASDGATDIEMPTHYVVEGGKDGPYWRMYERTQPRGYYIKKAPDHVKRRMRRKHLYAVYKRDRVAVFYASTLEKAAQWVILDL